MREERDEEGGLLVVSVNKDFFFFLFPEIRSHCITQAVLEILM